MSILRGYRCPLHGDLSEDELEEGLCPTCHGEVESLFTVERHRDPDPEEEPDGPEP